MRFFFSSLGKPLINKSCSLKKTFLSAKLNKCIAIPLTIALFKNLTFNYINILFNFIEIIKINNIFNIKINNIFKIACWINKCPYMS